MSIKVQALELPRFDFWSSLPFGFSQEAGRLEEIEARTREVMEEPVKSRGPLSAIRDLVDAIQLANKDNWDGEGAKGLEPQTIQNAVSFLKALPHQYAPPIIGPEPDGELAFEWLGHGPWVLSVSVGPQKQITYAAKLGEGAPVHDKEEWEEGAIPSRLAEILRQVVAHI